MTQSLSLYRFFLLTVFTSFGFGVYAQTSGNDYEKLSLIEARGINKNESVTFNMKFYTNTKLVEGSAESFMENYDSIAFKSYGFEEADGERILKIDAYVINTENNKRLKWLAAVDFTEKPRGKRYVETEKILSGKFIQFGAFDVFEYARKQLVALGGFEIDLVKVNGQFKLIAPYIKADFNRARQKYPELNVWVADYQKVDIVAIEDIEF
ncbi:MAG: hypothetical protein WBA74_01255 [Cyclobacteriaceae bacterium]